MGKFLRVAALFSCLGVLVVGIVALMLSSFRGCSAGKTSLGEIIEQSERMARYKEASFRRLDTKKQIAAEVIARQRSLAEAIEQFRALDQEWPPFRLYSKKLQDRGVSEDEWDGWGVIATVRVVLEHRPDEAVAAVARLEKELQELLASRPKRCAAPVEKPMELSR